jgi:hypothetical protein
VLFNLSLLGVRLDASLLPGALHYTKAYTSARRVECRLDLHPVTFFYFLLDLSNPPQLFFYLMENSSCHII